MGYCMHAWFTKQSEGALLHARYCQKVHFHPHDTASLFYIVTSASCYALTLLAKPSSTRKENGGHTFALTVGRKLLMLKSEYAFLVINTNACYSAGRLCWIQRCSFSLSSLQQWTSRSSNGARSLHIYLIRQKKIIQGGVSHSFISRSNKAESMFWYMSFKNTHVSRVLGNHVFLLVWLYVFL